MALCDERKLHVGNTKESLVILYMCCNGVVALVDNLCLTLIYAAGSSREPNEWWTPSLTMPGCSISSWKLRPRWMCSLKTKSNSRCRSPTSKEMIERSSSTVSRYLPPYLRRVIQQLTSSLRIACCRCHGRCLFIFRLKILTRTLEYINSNEFLEGMWQFVAHCIWWKVFMKSLTDSPLQESVIWVRWWL
jgi:hypothetical protein